MAQSNVKSKPLPKLEVLLLLDLIQKHQIVISKGTNATNNRLKEQAWRAIAHECSAKAGEVRRPEQLRLKWENLKKNARKRSANIRKNKITTDGAKIYIPCDEALDRVASILDLKSNGLPDELDGDREETLDGDREETSLESSWDLTNVCLPDDLKEEQAVQLKEEVNDFVSVNSDNELVDNELEGATNITSTTKHTTPRKFLFTTPKKIMNKKQKLTEDYLHARTKKDLAIAEYFKVKTKYMNLMTKKLKLEISEMIE